METSVTKNIRIFRSEETILNILNEHKKSKLSIKAFCASINIAQASFHNWKKKYGRPSVKSGKPSGFTSLQITTSAGANLFAEIKDIKIYQPVAAAYLKELL